MKKNTASKDLLEIKKIVEKIYQKPEKEIEPKKIDESLGKKRKRMNYKKFTFRWPELIDDHKIDKALGKTFSNSTYSVTSSDGSTVVNITCPKRKLVDPNNKKFVIEGIKPTIEPSYNFPISVPIPDSTTRGQKIVSCFDKFFENYDVETLKYIGQLLEIELQNMKVLLYSEYIVTSLVAYYLYQVGRARNWVNYLVISIDRKMTMWEKSENQSIKKEFRCDIVLLVDGKLIVFEHKFRKDRGNNQVQKALEDLTKKKYSIRTAYYLMRLHANIFKEMKSVTEIGIGFSLFKGRISLGIEKRDLEFVNNSSKI